MKDGLVRVRAYNFDVGITPILASRFAMFQHVT